MQLIPLPRISGRVVDGQGDPVPDFTLSLVFMSDPDRPPVVHTVAAPDGAFYLPLGFQGDWRMRVEAYGFEVAEVTLGGARLGEELDVGEIVLAPAG